MRYLDLAARALLATVFVAALAGKASRRHRYAEFVTSLRGMSIVPAALLRTVAATVVAAEATTVILLALPVRPVSIAGYVAALGVLALFTVAIARAVHRGRRAPCHCFGTSRTPLGWQHVARNLALLVVAGTGLLGLRSPPTVHAGAAALAVLVGVAGGAIVAALDDLSSLLRTAAPARPASATADSGRPDPTTAGVPRAAPARE